MSIDRLKRKLPDETDSRELYVALSDNEPVVVVDGRSAEADSSEHIPGSLRLPHKELCSTSTDSLDRSKTYVCIRADTLGPALLDEPFLSGCVRWIPADDLSERDALAVELARCGSRCHAHV